MLTRDREAHQRGESLPVRRFWQRRQRRQRVVCLGLREPRSVLKPPGRFNRVHDLIESFAAAFADDLAYQLGPLGGRVAQRVDQWQRRLAFGEVVTEILAAALRVGFVVEYVVDELVG